MIDKIMIWPAIIKTEWSTLIGSFTVNITQYALGYLHRSRLQGQEPDRTKRKNFGISRCCSGDNFLNTFSLAVLLIESQALVFTVLFLPYPPLTPRSSRHRDSQTLARHVFSVLQSRRLDIVTILTQFTSLFTSPYGLQQRGEVWRHISIVAKFLDLNFWKTMGYCFVPECNHAQQSHTWPFFFSHICRTMDPEIFLPW